LNEIVLRYKMWLQFQTKAN